MNYYQCKMCNRLISRPQWRPHLRSKVHLEKMTLARMARILMIAVNDGHLHHEAEKDFAEIAALARGGTQG
jgi:hypothetical protein